MGNFIQNGDFSSGFDYWHNGVGEDPYVLDVGKIKGSSYSASAILKVYNIAQSFSLNEEVIAGKITVWCKWVASGGNISDGYNQFVVELHKPDTSKVTLLDTTKTAENGEGYLLNNYDIKAHFTQYGTYWLYLTLKTVSSMGDNPDPPPLFGYGVSYGWYDNINVNIGVKKYKTVHEAIGGAESYSKFLGVSEQEIMQLSEAYNKLVKVKRFLEGVKLSETYEITASFNKEIAEVVQLVESFSTKASFKRSEQESVVLAEMYEILAGKKKEVKELLAVSEAYSFLLRRAISEVIKLAESFNKKVSVSKSEVIRLAEDWFIKGYFHYSESEIVKLAESYTYIRGKTGEATEIAKLKESIQAKRTHGNVETTYYIDLPTQWDEIAPATTKWIKSKVERN